jgi:DNA-binding response OmpR family regulator
MQSIFRSMQVMESSPLPAESDTARYICNGLKKAGFTVSWCRDGVEGLHRAAGERWDFVIFCPDATRRRRRFIDCPNRPGGRKTPVFSLSRGSGETSRIHNIITHYK